MYGFEKDRVVITDEENPKIVPQLGGIDKIVSFFYHMYKGERERKIHSKMKTFCTGVSINPLNANPTKWSNTLKQLVGNLPANCLSVFDHLVNLVFKV